MLSNFVRRKKQLPAEVKHDKAGQWLWLSWKSGRSSNPVIGTILQ